MSWNPIHRCLTLACSVTLAVAVIAACGGDSGESATTDAEVVADAPATETSETSEAMDSICSNYDDAAIEVITWAEYAAEAEAVARVRANIGPTDPRDPVSVDVNRALQQISLLTAAAADLEMTRQGPDEIVTRLGMVGVALIVVGEAQAAAWQYPNLAPDFIAEIAAEDVGRIAADACGVATPAE